ncbi:MAG TPA: hypothetical protein VMD97_09245 [Candidatus Aquilonibacter sp.]|nr:hypothetical protein [Candidatus Aquilonibacter sp.]
MSPKLIDTNKPRSVLPGAIAYVLLLALCVALIHPFVNTGISDDFSFIRSAKDFADTGRMIYNGWSSPILGWLIPYGALFIKLFGFSFTTARLATFSIAIVNGVLAQWILLRLRCSRVLALFGAAAVMFSPIGLPAAVLFFTDGPGLLVLLVTLVLCIAAVRAETPRSTQLWIAAAFFASLFLGTVRQLLWLCTLVMVPCTVWLVRKRKGVLPWSGACFAVVIAGLAIVMHWWDHQPYALREPLLTHFPLSSWARYLILPAMDLAVLLAPALSLFLFRRASRTAYLISVALLILVPLVMVHNPYDLLRVASVDIFEDAPHWIYLAAATYSIALIPLVIPAVREGLTRDSILPRGDISFRQLSVLLIPFSAALFLVADSRESFFARYLLPVVAALTIWLVKLRSDLREKNAGRSVAGTLVIAVYCALSVIVTHDLYRATDAILSLAKWYTAQGMPRDQIEEGFAFDGWYQIQQTGHINEPRIKLPAGAWVNHYLPAEIARCHNFFLPDTPSIHPVYGVGETLAPCFSPPVLHSVEYTAWMAPHHRTLFIAPYAPRYALPPR